MRRFLFVTLSCFSQTGGIEKFNRALMKAFVTQQQPANFSFNASGMYDTEGNDRYIPPEQYYAGKRKRFFFVWKSLLHSLRSDELIIGHLNLSLIGMLAKLLKPSVKVTIICHGIEVFKPVTGIQKKLLQKADRVLAVSQYTRAKLVEMQEVTADKIQLFPNTLDPWFVLPSRFEKPAYLSERYGIATGEKVLFTLTRLDSKEGYKGYDTVIRCIPALEKKGYNIKYIIGGKADEKEFQQVSHLITSLGLQGQVILAGFIADEEITDHYLMADVFVMPSKGEGFGIVFLEAIACGVPVLAGNKDGSTEALQFGKLGTLVDPDSGAAIQQALTDILNQPQQPKTLQEAMLAHFSFEQFNKRLQQVFLN